LTVAIVTTILATTITLAAKETQELKAKKNLPLSTLNERE
jgi:hypothetical protein